MADQFPNEGSSGSQNLPGESSDTSVELNIKTLDSQNYTFQVDKNMLVSAFKEKISNEIGVPVNQQRLIFRGKVLKDDHLLSEYQVENGHTLHLVARQPTQPPSSADTSSSGTNANSGSQGNDASSGNPQNRIGQISHSVVLGTFNVGDSGESAVPDLSRVIGAVLNSFGIGGQTSINNIGGMQSSTTTNVSSQTTQGNETPSVPGSNAGGQVQSGNQTQTGQAFHGQPNQSLPQVMQIPLTGAVPLPSLHLPLPDSLSTLSEFMTRMEQVLAQNGYQPNVPGDVPRLDLPSNSRGLQALSIVLRHAERLLSRHTASALSHIAGRLEQDGAFSDPSLRGQIQTEAAQIGLAMQHLGALLLELGRTVLTLRMGQSSTEASITPGPAVYISPSGPNPIMVQPFPLQTNSLFVGSAAQSNPMTLGPVGIGNTPRNINIHITAGTRASNGEGTQGDRGNGTGTGEVRVLPVRNIIAATVPSRSSGIAVLNSSQPGLGVSISQPTSDSTSLSSVISEVSSRLRSIVGGMQGENQPTSGSASSNASSGVSAEHSSVTVNRTRESNVSLPQLTAEGDKKEQNDQVQGSNDEAKESCSVGISTGETSKTYEEAAAERPPETSSSEKQDSQGGAQSIPLGLGLGSLDRKRRTKQQKPVVKSGDDGTSNNSISQNMNAEMRGQQLLQSCVSRSSGANRVVANDTQTSQPPASDGGNSEDRTLGQQSSDAQFDIASVMSQVMDSPAVNGLLSSVSQQTGVGSPNVLRNMFQQLTQNPQIMNTVSQIAQQVDGQDLGNMFSGLGGGGGQGGGIDLSRMMQQMMPVVSQVLGQVQDRPAAQQFPHFESESQRQYDGSTTNGNSSGQNIQVDLHEVAQRIGRSDNPGDIFRSIAENAARLNGNENSFQNILLELSTDEELVNDYMEMLQRDIGQGLQSDHGQD